MCIFICFYYLYRGRFKKAMGNGKSVTQKKGFWNPLPLGNGFSVTQIRYSKHFRYPNPLPKSVTQGNKFFPVPVPVRAIPKYSN